MDPMTLHEPHHARGLKGLGPLRAWREGLAEEEKVRHVDIEVRDEVAKVFPVLPHGIGAKTVNEKKGWLAWVGDLGHPAMHGGSAAEVDGGGAEAGGGEGLTVQPVS